MDDPMGFKSPNYTQTPNDLFDSLMADMDGAELKVVLAIVRQTFGYHREHATFGISKLQKMTGLSYNSVVKGAEEAEKRGLIRRTNPDAQTSAEWEIVVETPSKTEGTPSKIEGRPSKTEGQVRLNKEKEIQNIARSPDWMIAANIPSEEIAKNLEQERRTKEVLDHFERVMGYNPLPWHTDPKLARVKAHLLTKSKAEIDRFAAWSKDKYSGASPAKLRSNPQLIIDLWPQSASQDRDEEGPAYWKRLE